MYPKYLGRQALANSVKPGQRIQNEASESTLFATHPATSAGGTEGYIAPDKGHIRKTFFLLHHENIH